MQTTWNLVPSTKEEMYSILQRTDHNLIAKHVDLELYFYFNSEPLV